MNTFAPIPLNTDWRSYPPEDTDPTFGASQLDDSSWDVVPLLADWPRHLLGQAEMVHLQRKFDLKPIGDVCLRFFLNIAAAPDGTAAYINGWHAGTFQNGHPLTTDVTNYVTLEGNVLLLNVSKPGRFGDVYLQPVLCDEVH